MTWCKVQMNRQNVWLSQILIRTLASMKFSSLATMKVICEIWWYVYFDFFFVSTTAITQNTKTRGQTFWTRLNKSTIQIISVRLVNSRSLSKNQHNLPMRRRAAYDYLRKHFNFKQMLFHANQRHFIKKSEFHTKFEKNLFAFILPHPALLILFVK